MSRLAEKEVRRMMRWRKGERELRELKSEVIERA